LPPLQNGDHLSRAEFERRYSAMAEHVKAELIEGVVYMASPVSQAKHGKPHVHVIMWLGQYYVNTPGTEVGDNSTLQLDLDNEPQPDALLMIQPQCGGQTRPTEDEFLTGAPELVVEVAASSASYDLHEKLRTYRRNGVQEYIVWRTLDQALDWFVLREGQYEKLAEVDGLLKSGVFPGLWLDAAALLSGNMKRVIEVVQQGIASDEHAAFVQRLSAALK